MPLTEWSRALDYRTTSWKTSRGAVSAQVSDQMLLNLRTDWEVGGAIYPADALLAIDLDDFLSGKRVFEILFEPSERVSLAGVGTTANDLLYSTLDNVRGRQRHSSINSRIPR